MPFNTHSIQMIQLWLRKRERERVIPLPDAKVLEEAKELKVNVLRQRNQHRRKTTMRNLF